MAQRLNGNQQAVQIPGLSRELLLQRIDPDQGCDMLLIGNL